MRTSDVVRKVFTLAGRHGFPTDDPTVLKDGSNVLVHLSPAPVVARVGAVTAMVRGDVFEHFRRADDVSRFLAGRGVPVVQPLVEPVRHDGLVVSFAVHVEHDPGWRPDPRDFAALLADLHAELRHYPGDLPARGPLDDVDAVLDLLPDPHDLRAERDALVGAWPHLPTQPLHGDAHPKNVLLTPAGPVWNDFEDTWRGPVGWDVACAARSPLLDRATVARAYPADALGHWLAVRDLFGRCWRHAQDIYRTRTRAAT
ncbi:hypothetical protein SUDANB95_05865 [Actinosynnema sp. ALI-1.44]